MFKNTLFKNESSWSFNMTPIVDIVFLLIIFFMLVCQFIVAENFEVDIPQGTLNAQTVTTQNQKITTVSVLFEGKDAISYAVGSEIISENNKELLEHKITQSINSQLSQIEDDKKVVCLRMDRDITFNKCKHVLIAISNSIATDVQFSVLNDL